MNRIPKRRALPVLLAALGLLAAACGTEAAGAGASLPGPSGPALPSPSPSGPPPPPPCPESGLRVSEGVGDAALGLRVLSLLVTNCGTELLSVEGYPSLTLFGEDRRPVTEVRIEHGSAGIATVESLDLPPERLTLAPGESASAGLVWRNTVEMTGAPVNVPFVDVVIAEGEPPQSLELTGGPLDLGTTGLLGVGPWGPPLA